MTGAHADRPATKAGWRAHMKDVVAKTTPSQRHAWSAALCEGLLDSGLVGEAMVVLGYGAFRGEPDVARVGDVVTRRGGRLCMPVIDWDSGTMHGGEVHTLHVGAEGGPVEGRYGTPIAPEGAEVVPAWDIGVVLVPGMAFDARGGRLGRGAGFYDRYLRGFAGLTIGVCFDVQVIDRVPMEEGDVRLDAVATESGVCMVRG
ncbi:MAG: 5-formyltetrahydrofolate cyclo-ligase [Planctomycetota bacterium]